ncbi:hypothetical protein GCM10023229_40240 [Flavisolibacter ginsenosidimutans]
MCCIELPNAQVSDTRGADSSNAAKYIKKYFHTELRSKREEKRPRIPQTSNLEFQTAIFAANNRLHER